jgi:endonuclease/exonuclease/phosphatase family metal-dependent hydrolase
MLTTLTKFLAHNIRIIHPTLDSHVLWVGDFNHHHPLWEEMRNQHLFNYIHAQPLIDLIANYGMIQLLPLGIPTLQSTSSKNWTRPDNVFGMEHTNNTLIECTTDPSQRDPCTDHVPIITILELTIPKTNK